VVGKDLGADSRQCVGGQAEHIAVYGDAQQERHLLRRLLHQAAQHLDHPQAALDCRCLRIINTITSNPNHIGSDRPNRAQRDRSLTE